MTIRSRGRSLQLKIIKTKLKMKNEEGKKTIWISEKLHQKLKMQSVIERKTIFSLVQEMYDSYKK